MELLILRLRRRQGAFMPDDWGSWSWWLSLSKPRVFQHLCSKTDAPLHPTLQTKSGCTMEALRSGSQYWQNPQYPPNRSQPVSLGLSQCKSPFFDSLVRRLLKVELCENNQYINLFHSSGTVSCARVSAYIFGSNRVTLSDNYASTNNVNTS